MWIVRKNRGLIQADNRKSDNLLGWQHKYKYTTKTLQKKK